MMPMDDALWRLDAVATANLIRTGRTSAREVTRSVLARMEAVDPKLNAVVVPMAEAALEAAAAADKAQARGEFLAPLHGVPVTVKINTDQKDCATSNGVVAFRDNIAAEDAPVVANLRRAGAIIIGRTNTPAFSMRIFTENDLHGRTPIRATGRLPPAAPRAAPGPPSPPASAPSGMATTSAARCASPPIAAACWACASASAASPASTRASRRRCLSAPSLCPSRGRWPAACATCGWRCR